MFYWLKILFSSVHNGISGMSWYIKYTYKTFKYLYYRSFHTCSCINDLSQYNCLTGSDSLKWTDINEQVMIIITDGRLIYRCTMLERDISVSLSHHLLTTDSHKHVEAAGTSTNMSVCLFFLSLDAYLSQVRRTRI